MGDAPAIAREYVRGHRDSMSEEELRRLVRDLKGQLEFGLARKVLVRAREQGFCAAWFLQQLALCTYKDEELVPSTRFREALGILGEVSDRAGGAEDFAERSETLSLKGAVYKRMWEYGGLLEDLHRSLAYYCDAWDHAGKPEPGSQEPPAMPRDCGYSAVNAAFILDILHFRSKWIVSRGGEQLEFFRNYEQDARKLREDALTRLNQALALQPDLLGRDWMPQTMAELHFGLRSYDQAGEWLARARKVFESREGKSSEWEKQTTFKQLVSIARHQGIRVPRPDVEPKDWEAPWRALSRFLGEQETASALSCYRGKVGLALSGGGFRASLFHIGVLARLAEVDVLRSVEVLSTVSGGSIVGAHYYLEVQDMLTRYKDHENDREDYIDIVRRVLSRFLAGVQKNLRMSALSDIRKNIEMIYSNEYSRSHRLGELYEEAFYSVIGESGEKRASPPTMPDLLITPADEAEGSRFNPRFSNWRRLAKVPVLILNATSLNSGHNWHFTASWMGEPPGRLETEIDINERYRRLWYRQAVSEKHQKYPLGYAVAASACVPGLFEPLVLEGLYPGRTVRLVDGGVHDNQGVASLLDEGCTLIFCSDACGQMNDQARPSDSLLGVPLRSNSILMDRVREAVYQDLRSRVDSRALEGLFFIHLKKDLETLPIDWIECDDPTIAPHEASSTTVYGVDKDLQRKLAAIRTDLDSFTEVEAYSLMLSGYLMTEHELRELNRRHQEVNGTDTNWGGYDIGASRGDWPFLQLEDLMRQPPDASDARRADLGKQLKASSSLAFKVFKLDSFLRVSLWSVIGFAIFCVLWLAAKFWATTLFEIDISPGVVILTLGMLLVSIVVPLAKWLQPEQAVKGYVNKALVALFGYLAAKVQLTCFDRRFIERGKLKRLLELR